MPGEEKKNRTAQKGHSFGKRSLDKDVTKATVSQNKEGTVSSLQLQILQIKTDLICNYFRETFI